MTINSHITVHGHNKYYDYTVILLCIVIITIPNINIFGQKLKCNGDNGKHTER